MKIDWLSKLQHYLQALAFCLAVATIQYAFTPEKPYAPPVIYSILIGSTIWACIDLGRHFVPGNSESGWPTGWRGAALVAGAIVAGFLVGNVAGDALCRMYGLNIASTGQTPGEWRSSILITLLAGITGTYWFYSRHRSNYLETKMGEAQKHASEARLKLLETQLEPHMLFNTLANLRALIAVDPPRAQQMLDHIIAYLRATLDASRAPTHTLQAEYDRLRDYLELMAIRMGPRLAFELDLPANVAGESVPTLLLQPIVENSIQHGLEPKVEGGRVRVSARRDGNRLLVEVQDTGVGRADAERVQGKGFGLAQVRERLSTLYGSHASIDFQATPDEGAHTVITLPLPPRPQAATEPEQAVRAMPSPRVS